MTQNKTYQIQNDYLSQVENFTVLTHFLIRPQMAMVSKDPIFITPVVSSTYKHSTYKNVIRQDRCRDIVKKFDLNCYPQNSHKEQKNVKCKSTMSKLSRPRMIHQTHNPIQMNASML